MTQENTPYTGCDVAASAICYNKLYNKHLLRSLNFKTTNFISIRRSKWYKNDPLPQVDSLGFPVFVKPACGGSSIGVSIAHNRQEFVDAVDVAFNTVRVKQETDVVLVEKPCTGREIEVGVLEEGDGKIIALSTGEILQNQLGSAQFYDYKTKYTCLTAAVCPANLDAQQDAEVKQIAIDVFDRLNLRGFARVDFPAG